MTIFVLDSSAVLRFMDEEAGWQRIQEIFIAHRAATAEVAIPAIQWGEIAGRVRKKLGEAGQQLAMRMLAELQPAIVPATGERAVRAAALKVDRKIPFADAFALELAMDSAEHVLVTADYDFKAVADLARIEFLPVK